MRIIVVASICLAWSLSLSAVTTGPVTFTRDIPPILYKHCAACHRAGEAAPFPLLSYAYAAKRAALIAQVTASRYMPPWRPERGHGDLAGARTLTAAEI